MATQETISFRSASRPIPVLLKLQDFRQRYLPAIPLIVIHTKDLLAIISEVIQHRRLPSASAVAWRDAFSRKLDLNSTPKLAAHP